MEDEFDGANRKNLLHFIQEKHGIDAQTSQEKFEGVSPGHTFDQLRSLTYVSRTLEPTDDADECAKEKLIEKRELIRISTCSIFHKYSRGPGVPHTFVGLIRQWPALPQVVVSTVVSRIVLNLFDHRFSCPFVFCPSPEFRHPSDTLLEKSGRLEVRKFFFFYTGVTEQIELGIYGVTYYLGFRDKFDVDVSLGKIS